jgi:membrane protein EpsK
MTPFYIHHLGVGGFGVVQIALLLPVYINLSTLIISGAVSRFLTIALHEQNHNNANQIFNTSLFGIALILTFAMPIIIYFAININMYINIPLQYTQDSIYLFLGIFFSSTLTIFSTLFLIPAYANNRLDIQNYIKITTLFIQTGLVFFTFLIIASNLSYIGYAYTIAAFLGLFFSISIWKEFAPFLKISKSFIKFSKFQEIASMGSWLLINQMGSILFLSIDLILINHFFGPDATGKYSIVLQWSVLLRSMASMIASVLDPLILISYAKNNFLQILQYSNFAVKFMGIVIAIPLGRKCVW